MKKILSLLAAIAISSGLLPAQEADTMYQATEETFDHARESAANGFADEQAKAKVYLFPIREDIMPSTARLTSKCLEQAREIGADYIVINMNTYGGLLDAADTIRTMLLNCEIPVLTFVNNQAASAGALIAIATDSIYMRPGASIGAATVVDQSGADLPDKYQSFMRSMMRATAESHGKVPVVGPGGDTTWRWRRDPDIAQAMVDPTIVVPGLVDSTKVVTLTADEAIRWGYCEGRASSVGEVLIQAGVEDYELIEYESTWLDKLLGFLTNPTVQGILIMLIIGGIYFELQTPGVGFPLVVAILGAVMYFSPLYVEGLVAHWELALFIIGLVLVALEIFVTPGFGVLGILGIIAVVTGLAFALIDTNLLRYIPTGELPVSIIVQPFLVVIVSVSLAIVLSLWISNRFLKGDSRFRRKVVLVTDMTAEEGYVGRYTDRGLVGRQAVTTTALRPAGKVMLDGEYYEAAGDNAAFIEKGETVIIVRDEGGVLYCVKHQ